MHRPAIDIYSGDMVELTRTLLVVGVGIGELSGKAFRIAHMGHENAPMMFGVLGAVEMGLAALGIPHGSAGVQAAVDYLAREVRPQG